MTTQLTNDFLCIAILEAKGILTPVESEALMHAAIDVTPISPNAAAMLVHDTLEPLGSWETCEVCRRVMYDWRENLTAHHGRGHPVIQVQ